MGAVAALADVEASDTGAAECVLRFDLVFSASTVALLPRRVKGRLGSPMG
jgi:hypothetical protein